MDPEFSRNSAMGQKWKCPKCKCWCMPEVVKCSLCSCPKPAPPAPAAAAPTPEDIKKQERSVALEKFLRDSLPKLTLEEKEKLTASLEQIVKETNNNE